MSEKLAELIDDIDENLEGSVSAEDIEEVLYALAEIDNDKLLQEVLKDLQEELEWDDGDGSMTGPEANR